VYVLLAEGDPRAGALGVAAAPGPVAVGALFVPLVLQPDRLAVGGIDHHLAALHRTQRMGFADRDRVGGVSALVLDLAALLIGQEFTTVRQRRKARHGRTEGGRLQRPRNVFTRRDSGLAGDRRLVGRATCQHADQDAGGEVDAHQGVPRMEMGIQAQVCLKNTGKRKNPSHFRPLCRPTAASHSAFHAPVNGTAVFCCTSPRPTPGASSAKTRPSGPTSNTARSVMIRLTTPRPVSGRVHSGRILESPFLVQCSISTTTRLTPATRSIAPPMPLTILPGTIQLARSPLSVTSIAPRIARSTWPPRIMAKESWLPK